MVAIIRCTIFCLPACYSNIKIKMYRIIILPIVLFVYVTWSLTLRDERRLRVFQNRILRRIFGPKETDENYIMKSVMICTVHQTLFG